MAETDTNTFEYRIGWSASSNASFRDTSDWMEWGGFEETAEDVELALHEADAIPVGLEVMLKCTGIDWWVEVRESVDASDPVASSSDESPRTVIECTFAECHAPATRVLRFPMTTKGLPPFTGRYCDPHAAEVLLVPGCVEVTDG